MALKFGEKQKQAALFQIGEMLDAMQDIDAEKEDIFSSFVIYLRDKRLFYGGNCYNGMDKSVFTFQNEKNERESCTFEKSCFYACPNSATKFSGFNLLGKAETRQEIGRMLLDCFIDENMTVRDVRLACRSAEKMPVLTFSFGQKAFVDDL